MKHCLIPLWGRVAFDLLRSVVITVSAIDMYFAIKYRDTMVELNPIGVLLMNMDNGGVALFMSLKLIGTTVALWLMGVLYCTKRKLAVSVTIGVAIFQLGLAAFLYFG